jgi:O-antigen/teichoic acid export membrane protein
VLIQILAFHIPLAAMDTVLATALIAANRQRRYLYVSLMAAALNPIACILLIHWADSRYGNGAIGAALVTVATELFILGGALRLRTTGVLDWATSKNLGLILLAGGAMVPVLIVGGSLPLLVQVALGAATYPVALLLFRAVGLDEIRRFIASSPLGRRREASEKID